jgi:hypothetical protein
MSIPLISLLLAFDRYLVIAYGVLLLDGDVVPIIVPAVVLAAGILGSGEPRKLMTITVIHELLRPPGSSLNHTEQR